MEIKSLQIYKIDKENDELERIEPSAYGDSLLEYLQDLFTVVISKSTGRKFEFSRKTTEIRAQITRIINDEDFEDICLVVATRLLSSEISAQERMARMNIEIQKGIVVQALINDSSIDSFIICKAEHNDFLDDIKYEPAKGLPVKKKAFKAFICDLNSIDEENGILVYDTNRTDTKYWWNEFLELTKLFTDERNTENAFNAIDKGVFTKIKRKHPEDYMYLRNSTVRYFRSNEMFEMTDFLDNAIGNYEPVHKDLNILDLKTKIKDLTSKKRSPFDNQFNIIKGVIKANFISKVKLTEHIDLVIKEDYPENSILGYKAPDGTKYVQIKSEEGYLQFKKAQN